MPGPHIFLRILLWARWRLHCPQSIVLLLTSWSWSLLTSVSPSPKVGQWMRSVVFQPVFQKNIFLHTPLGNMKRQPLQQTGRAGCHLPQPHSCPVQASGKEGQEPWRGCGVSALPPFCQPRQGFLSRWPGLLSGVASVWELLSSSSSSPPFPLFLFGKFDQVASGRVAFGLKSKPELQLQESLPGFHGDGLWPPVPLGAEQGFPHKGRPRPCSTPRSTHTAGWLQTSQSDF